MVIVPEDIMFAQPEPDGCEPSEPGQQRFSAADVTRAAMSARNMPDNVWVDEALYRPQVSASKCIRRLAIRRRVRVFVWPASRFAIGFHGSTLAWISGGSWRREGPKSIFDQL
jgi:hypothetical protein